MFDNKIITLVKLHMTSSVHCQIIFKRNVLYCQIAFKHARSFLCNDNVRNLEWNIFFTKPSLQYALSLQSRALETSRNVFVHESWNFLQ